MKSLLIIADKKCIDDYRRAVAAFSAGRGIRANYLLNRLLLENVHQVTFFKYSDRKLQEKIKRNSTKKSVLIVHIDKTVIPAPVTKMLKEYERGGMRLVNSRATDISKKKVDQVCRKAGLKSLSVNETDSHKGRVMLKSDFNSWESHIGYKIYRSTREIPKKFLHDDNAVIQKFVHSDRVRGGYFRMERFVCVGNTVVFRTFYSRDRVIKAKSSISYYQIPESLLAHFSLPAGSSVNELEIGLKRLTKAESADLEKIHRVRKAMGLDLGSIDTIRDRNGHLYILDVNKTAYESKLPDALGKVLTRVFFRGLE